MAKDPIKTIVLKDGSKRYRFVIDIGPRGDGGRKQLTVTKDTKREAADELASLRQQRNTGTLIAPNKLTVNELLDLWLREATRDVEESTAGNYESGVLPVRTFLGRKPLQKLTEDDIDDLIEWMLTEGRRRAGKPGTPLGLGTVRYTLGRLRAALNLAIRRRLIGRNVAEYSKISREQKRRAAKPPIRPWTETEVKKFIAAISGHRLFAVMLLALIANRPAEVCGLRWEEDVDLEAETVAITNTRTMVYDRAQKVAKVVEKGPKSEAAERTLPLPAPALRALRTFKTTQAKEKLAAGRAYEDSGYVLVDQLGRPWKTNKLRYEAYKLMELAGVRKVRLYDARHACLSWMANSGVPDTVVSAWAGHADLSFTKRVYVHPDPESLKAGSDKLSELLS